ncbi:PIR Superfamily Protein [Plasmodium ovale wallikeri]|uniref:PIR Superfamily Protein n=2 Tax=Plasmodium ovale TaxID=36330 RepID=A0A1A8Z825_PLAOA|nr:PIR Superfamily Protein [Plasmodium ovale wallikeri]SBT39984.1 PIR Superfamily Protein [Plasmodium ovale wallikeri]SBT74632.1 PIR protein [Plasmodium ovale]
MLNIFCEFCNELKNILNDSDESSSKFKLSFKGKYCDLLNYWLYDELIQTNLDSNVIRSFYSILKFVVIIFYKEKCFLHDFKADKVVLKKRKKSFEFFELYNGIKHTLRVEAVTKNSKYLQLQKG